MNERRAWVDAVRYGDTEALERATVAWLLHVHDHRVEIGHAVAEEVPGHLGKWAIASLHRSGRVRERACRELVAFSQPVVVGLLLLRANDWVEEVRAAAIAELERRRSPGHLLAYYPLVERLGWGRRVDHQRLIVAIDALIAAHPQVFEAAIQSRDRDVQRAALGFAVDHELALGEAALARILDTQDPRQRLAAAKLLLRGPLAVRYADRLSLDPLPLVRALAAREGPVERERLVRLAIDRSTSVRMEAQYALRAKLGVDLRALYRELVTGAPARGALLGLGEAGHAVDCEAIEVHLLDARPAVREATVRALGALDPHARADDLYAAIEDPSARVSRAALRALLRGRVPFQRERLMEMLHDREAPAHVRAHAQQVARLGRF